MESSQNHLRVSWKALTGLPTLSGLMRGIPASGTTAMQFVIISYLFSIALDSPLRFFLNIFHLAALMYLRDIALLGIIFIEFLISVRRRAAHKGVLLIISILVIHSAINFLILRNPLMTAFGMKVFLPFAASLIASSRMNIKVNSTLSKAFGIIWLLTIIGIFLDKAGAPFPWRGFSVDIGGIEIEGNRDWTTVGFARLAGFTRASFDAAMLLATLPFIFMFFLKRWLRIIVLMLSLIAIALTITKAILLAFLATSFLIIALEFKHPLRHLIAKSALIFGLASMAGIPLYYKGMQFYTDRFNPIQEIMLGSFRERINSTWPNAWTFINDPILSFFGVGIGGIGVSQKLFGSGGFQPGDNTFVYFRVVFGLTSYLYISWIIWCGLKKRRITDIKSTTLPIFLLLLSGVSLSIPESATAAIILGLFVLPFSSKKTHSGYTDKPPPINTKLS